MNLLRELNDKILLGLDGLSDKPPRLTARAIVKNKDGLYAVMYAAKFGLHSLPGGGIEEGEDPLTALRREIFEETGCACDHIEELGIVTENRAHQDFTCKSYYYAVTTDHAPEPIHLTEDEIANKTTVQWHRLDEVVRLISMPKHTTTQRMYLQARDVAALLEYINVHFEKLSMLHGVPIEIKTIYDVEGRRFQILEESGTHNITLNAAKIPAPEYALHAGYHVGKILLPRLRLETERLILRRYQPQDSEQCFSFLSNEQDAYMDCRKAFTAMDEAYQEIVTLFGQRETQYMIVLKESGKVIGTVHVFADNSRAVEALEIGYSIAHDHQRKGYAYEALSALLDLLQNALCIEMITAGALPENLASEKLLLKLGFQKEGLRCKAVWHKGLDRPVDLIYYYRDRQANK